MHLLFMMAMRVRSSTDEFAEESVLIMIHTVLSMDRCVFVKGRPEFSENCSRFVFYYKI